EIDRNQLDSLPEGEYYHFQVIGLEVRTTGGELLGKIIDILSTPGNDNYVVSANNEEILIPAIEDVVQSINIEGNYLVIEPIEGLLNLNKKAAG
ncbi:MAG: ribosome maturation factor RimM, partial [Dehalococcoidales bacterium]|nr:ribosome maturation factor RimM [Dehalococcoidales bacterium]